jgi:hypothetical protein
MDLNTEQRRWLDTDVAEWLRAALRLRRVERQAAALVGDGRTPLSSAERLELASLRRRRESLRSRVPDLRERAAARAARLGVAVDLAAVLPSELVAECRAAGVDLALRVLVEA